MSETEHKTYDDYHDLRGDGRIVMYKRRDHHNPRWNVRIKVPGKTGYVVKSCKTTDFHEARRFSEDLYYELEGRSRRYLQELNNLFKNGLFWFSISLFICSFVSACDLRTFSRI